MNVWEIGQSKPDKAIAVRGREPRERNWPYSLGGRDSVTRSVPLSCQSQQH